jgi:hypothetical protein
MRRVFRTLRLRSTSTPPVGTLLDVGSARTAHHFKRQIDFRFRNIGTDYRSTATDEFPVILCFWWILALRNRREREARRDRAKRVLCRVDLPRRQRVEMGIGRTSHRALGSAAMNVRSTLAGAALAVSVLATSGCQSIGAATGAVAAVGTGAVTTNPAIGIGVGIAVQAATDEAVMRGLHQDQQDAIASLVGATPVGGTQTWRVQHWLPLENGHGQVRVTRAFSSALAFALCKEFAFSVADGDRAHAREIWYTATACLAPQGWRWASAEPAVPRWGNLQ